MHSELEALKKNATWILVPKPKDANLVGSKWIFRTKYKPDGSIDRYKARLVARGFNQRPGIDFFETFSPVIKPTTIRLVLSIAISRGWPIRQFDVDNAFLNGDLHENVYMSQPPGFRDTKYPEHVCLLKKAIYGLKQSPRAWFHKLREFLHSSGFRSCKTDASLFVRTHGDSLTYMLVYVDDLVLTGSDSNFISEFIIELHQTFSLKDLGLLNYLLGVEVKQQHGCLLLNQSKYILELLSRAGMEGCKPMTTPAAPRSQLTAAGKPMSDPSMYRHVVGSLQYAAITRPDIAYAVNRVCQFLHAPTEDHWIAVKRILRYLKGTYDHGIVITPSSNFDLVAYSDADWAGDPENCRSTQGYCVYFGGNIISWSSTKQRSVARSSTESEYKSLASATTELIWIQQLMRELHIPLTRPPILYCDNLSATYMASNPILHKKSKHIRIDFHFVREKVEQGQLQVVHLPARYQVADIFTKALPKNYFRLFQTKLNLSSVISLPEGVKERIHQHHISDLTPQSPILD
ncbi:unnamed protein product [Rhodiola kirilowii]